MAASVAAADAAVRRLRAAFIRGVWAPQAVGSERQIQALVKRLAGLTPAQVERVSRRAIAGIVEGIASDVARRVRVAARAGALASRQGLLTAVGEATAGSVGAASAAAQRAAARVLAAGVDGMTLSARLHGTAAAYRQQMVRVVAQAQAEAVGSRELARRIVDDAVLRGRPVPTDAIQRLRQSVRRMGRGGGPRAIEAAQEAAEDLARHAARLSETAGRAGLGMRPAAEHAAQAIQRAIERGSAESAKRAIRWWAHDKMRYQALVVARTESARAWSEGFVAQAQEVPGVAGLIWHTRGDARVCEECAARDGQTYPLDDLPDLPVHPHCRCYWTHAIDRQRAISSIVDRAMA